MYSLQAMSEPTSDSMLPPSPSSLLVVGAGELGCRVAHKWKDLFPKVLIAVQLYVRIKLLIKPNLPPKAKVYLKVRRSLPERAERWAKLGFSVAEEFRKQTDYISIVFIHTESARAGALVRPSVSTVVEGNRKQ